MLYDNVIIGIYTKEAVVIRIIFLIRKVWFYSHYIVTAILYVLYVKAFNKIMQLYEPTNI